MSQKGESNSKACETKVTDDKPDKNYKNEHPPRNNHETKVASSSSSGMQSHAEPVGKPIRFGNRISRPIFPEFRRTNQIGTVPKRKCEPESPIENDAPKSESPTARMARSGDKCQHARHDFPKRPKLEVFVMGEDSDAEAAESPCTELLMSKSPERELGWYHNN